MSASVILETLERDVESHSAWASAALAVGAIAAGGEAAEVEELFDGLARLALEATDAQIPTIRQALLDVLSGYSQAMDRVEARAIEDEELAKAAKLTELAEVQAAGVRTREVATWLKEHGPKRHGQLVKDLLIDPGQLTKLLDHMLATDLIEEVQASGMARNARLCRLRPRGERLAELHPWKPRPVPPVHPTYFADADAWAGLLPERLDTVVKYANRLSVGGSPLKPTSVAFALSAPTG